LRQVGERLVAAVPRLVSDRRHALDRLAQLLESYSYEQVLKRGFALVRDSHNQPVQSAGGATPGDRWTITFHDRQTVPVVVVGGTPDPRHTGKKQGAKEPDGRQGTLL
jgi:exodeoxyribonuclease VII large subunit